MRLKDRVTAIFFVVVLVVSTVASPALAASATTTLSANASEQALAVGNSDDVTFVDANGTRTSVGASATAVGSMTDLDGDDRAELPYVENGTLKATDATGETHQLATGVASPDAVVGTGDWDENGRPGVLYVNTSDGDQLYRAEVGDDPQRLLDVPASSILGIASFDSDGDDDIVFLGDSNGIKYFDDGRVRSTGYYDIGTNQSVGVGAPADFDRDGTARVPVVSESNDLVLVSATGDVQVVKSDYTTAAKAPLAAFDWVGDADHEIIHVGDDGLLRYAALNGSVGLVRDENGSTISASAALGVSSYPATNRTVSPSETATGLIRALDAATNATATHELTYDVGENSSQVGNALDSVEVQYPNASADVRDVTVSDVIAGIDRDDDGTIDAGLNATDSIDSVSAPANSTLRVTFNWSESLQANDTIVVRYGNVTNPDTEGTYSVTALLNDATNRTGSIDVHDPASGTVEATVTQVGPNEISITSPTVSDGGTLTADLPATELADSTGAYLGELDVTFAEDAHTNATLTQTQNLSVPAVGANDSNVTNLTYYRLSGPSPTSSEVETAQFRFSVNTSAISQDPDEVGLYRYVNDSWTRLPTTLADWNETTYTFVADSPGVGEFAVATEDGLEQAPNAIESVSIVDEVDRDGDGNVSDFAVEVEANTRVLLDNGSVGDPYYEVYVDGELQRILGVTAQNNSTETIVLNSRRLASSATDRDVRVVLWDDDEYDANESGRDKADVATAGVTYETSASDATTNDSNLSIAIDSGGIYAEMDNRSLNASFWDSRAEQYANVTAKHVRDELEAQIEDTTYHLVDVGENDSYVRQRKDFIYNTSAKVLSNVPWKLTRAAAKRYSRLVNFRSRLNTLENVVQAKSYFVAGAQSYAVGRHLDDPGYNGENYTRLHGYLQALSENSDELETARANDNTSRIEDLLEDRKQLLEETYRLVPAYADETHQSVVYDLAGEEDLQSYEITRELLATLRNALRTDYTATTRALDGYPGTLGGRRDMPTNGWTVEYSTKDALESRWGDYLTSRKTSAQSMGEILGRLLTPNELYPSADKYGDSIVFDSIDGFEDYTVYRIETDPELPSDGKLKVEIARPGRNPENVTRFDAVLMQDPPENLSEVDGQALSPVENRDSEITQRKTIDAPKDTYYLVVRSNITAGLYQVLATTKPSSGTAGGNGGTAIEVVDRQGSDTQRPTLTLEDAPQAQQLRHGQTVHVSADESVSLDWHAWDVGSDASELEYKYRIANQSGTSNWSAWQSVGAEGDVSQHFSLSEGYHDVQMVVRDQKGYRTERIVTVKTDVSPPFISVSSVGSEFSPLVRTLVDERVRYVEYQYQDANETGNWTDWRRIENTDELGLLPFEAGPGTYELRGRAVDLAGRTSDWNATTITVEDDTNDYTDYPDRNRTNVSENGTADGNGTITFNASNETWNGTGGDSSFLGFGNVTVGLDGIDGDTVVTLWADTRNFPRVKIASINLTADENVTLTELVPPELWANTEIIVEFHGNGTAHLKHINLTRATPMFVNATPDDPSVGETVTFEASTVEGYRDHIQQVEWDLDNDGTYEQTGWNASRSFSTKGNKTVRMRGTNDHNETVVVTKTIEVNALPSVTLNGTDTVQTYEQARVEVVSASDPDGSVVGYEWDVDDDGTYERSGRTIYPVFADDGNHTVTVRVTDDDNGTATATYTVEVTNRAPTAAIDQSVVAANESVELSALDSSDPDGSVVEYEWDTDDDGIYDATGESITTQFDSTGPATVTLRVTDDDDATNVTTKNLTVTHRPTVTIQDPGEVTEDVEHTFEANASDADGNITAYNWTFGDLSEGTGETANHTYTEAGNYTVTVTVTGEQGLTATDSITVTVNSPPTADVAANETTLNTSEAVFLDGTGSSDPNDGDSLTYDWTLGDGTNATGSSVVHRYDTAGTYTAELTVTDEFGKSDTANVTLTVDDAPTANGTVTPTDPNPDETVEFDGSNSSDPNANDSLTYEWDFGDGTTATGENVTHAYSSGGNYTVTLTVTDSYGKSDTETWTVSANHVPSANVTASPTKADVDETVDFDASNSTDADADSLTYDWDFDGDGTYDCTGCGATTSHAYSSEGTYDATVRVTDDSGATDTDDVTVKVEITAPTEGLVAHYLFDGNVTDETGDHDADNNGASFENGVDGKAVSFGGSSYVDFKSAVNEIDGSNAITVSYWIRVDSYGSNMIVWKAMDNGTNEHFQLYTNGDEWRSRVSDGSSKDTAPFSHSKIGTDTWVHVTQVFDGSTNYVYVNGTQIESTSYNYDHLLDNTAYWLGKNPGNEGDYFHGDVDDYRLYNRTLNSSEVGDVYNATK